MNITRVSKIVRTRPDGDPDGQTAGRERSRRRLRRRALSLLAGAGLVLTLIGVAPTAPAGATTYDWYYWGTNSMTPKMWTQGCYYRTQYGNFGAEAYGIVRMYGGSCGGKDLAIYIADSEGDGYFWSNQQYSSGTDSCGPYYQIFTSKMNAYALGVGFGNASHVRALSFQSSGFPGFIAC